MKTGLAGRWPISLLRDGIPSLRDASSVEGIASSLPRLAMTGLIAVFFIAACASAPERRILRITPGMTPQQVLEIAGEPTDRSFRGTHEQWVYGNPQSGQPKHVVFRGGKVVSLEALAAHNGLQNAPPTDASAATLPCAGNNAFGSFAEGGGCNMYGCWPPGGYCNAFGCSAQGNCTYKRCPKPIDSYTCTE